MKKIYLLLLSLGLLFSTNYAIKSTQENVILEETTRRAEIEEDHYTSRVEIEANFAKTVGLKFGQCAICFTETFLADPQDFFSCQYQHSDEYCKKCMQEHTTRDGKFDFTRTCCSCRAPQKLLTITERYPAPAEVDYDIRLANALFLAHMKLATDQTLSDDEKNLINKDINYLIHHGVDIENSSLLFQEFSLATINGDKNKIELFTMLKCQLPKKFIIKNSPITTLDLSFDNNQCTEIIINNCPELTTIKLGNFDDLKTIEINGCPKLKTLTLGNCPELQKLDTSRCTALTTLTLSNCSKLQTLNTSWCEALTTLALGYCPELQTLYTSWCEALTTLTLSDYPELQILDTSHCSSLTTLALVDCTKLQTLYTSHCSALTTLALGDCPKLQILYTPWCTAFTTLALGDCPKLQTFNTSHCSALTTLTLGNCPKLQIIKISNCQLTEEAIQAIQTQYPNTEIVR